MKEVGMRLCAFKNISETFFPLSIILERCFHKKKINRTKSIFLNFLFQFIGNLCFVATSEYFIRYNYSRRSAVLLRRCLLLITHRLHSIDCTINCFVARTWPALILHPSSPSRRCINNKKRALSRYTRPRRRK